MAGLLTPIYGFPYERPPFTSQPHEPGISLHGGSLGNEDILALALETEVDRMDGDIVDVKDDLVELRARLSWERIDEGTHDGGAFSIPVPSLTYSQLRLHLRGHLDALGTVRLRINDDDTTGLHRTSIWSRAGTDGGNYYNAVSDGAPQWQIAHWASTAGNVCTTQLYVTHVTANVGYVSEFGMMSAGIHQNQGLAAGRLNSARLVSSLNIRPFSSGSNVFTSLFWWLEGYRAT